jgi:hypothetical protein
MFIMKVTINVYAKCLYYACSIFENDIHGMAPHTTYGRQDVFIQALEMKLKLFYINIPYMFPRLV